jgi:hypothetical protein
MSNSYYDIGVPLRFTSGVIQDSLTKTISSGAGNVEIFRYTPGLNGVVSAHFISLWSHCFTDIGVSSQNWSYYHSRFGIENRNGVLTIVPSVDEVVSPEYTLTIESGDCVLYVSRHATLPRSVTTRAQIHTADGTTDTSFSSMSTST